MVERRSPKPEAEGSSPSAPANLSLEIMRNPIKFIQEVKQEAFKVTWPTWKELQEASVLVFIASLIFAGIIFLMDYVFGVNAEDSLWRGIIGFLYDLL